MNINVDSLTISKLYIVIHNKSHNKTTFMKVISATIIYGIIYYIVILLNELLYNIKQSYVSAWI